jgi:hypothetical protein
VIRRSLASHGSNQSLVEKWRSTLLFATMVWVGMGAGGAAMVLDSMRRRLR